MKSSRRLDLRCYCEPALILLLGLFLCLLGVTSLGARAVNFVYHSSLWAERGTIIAGLCLGYGLAGLGLAGLSFFSVARGHTLVSRLAVGMGRLWSDFRAEMEAFRQSDAGRGWFWPLAALAIGAGARGYYLSQPMRGDESYTFLNFANKDFLALFGYDVPNNHVLHTLLVKLSILLLGASPVSIRMPAFLMGLLTILLTYALARRLNPGPNSGRLAALSAAVFPYLILYSTNARGYTLIVVLTLLAALIGLKVVEHLTFGRVALLAFVSALGMLTMPSMLVGAAGVFCWLAAVLFVQTDRADVKKILLEFTLPFGVLSGIFTLILYTPVMLVAGGLGPIIANRYVESQTWPDFLAGLLPQSLKTVEELTRDVPMPVLVVGVGLALLGLVLAVRPTGYIKRDWQMRLTHRVYMLPGLLAGSLAVMLLQHTNLYSRTWIFMLPFIFVLADAGLGRLLAGLSPGWQSLAQAAVLVGALVYAGGVMSSNVISQYADTSAFPEAQLAVEYLKPILGRDDAVHVTGVADWPFYFYCWYYDVPVPPSQTKSGQGHTYIIVKKSRYSVNDMTDKSVVKLLDFNDLALYEER